MLKYLSYIATDKMSFRGTTFVKTKDDLKGSYIAYFLSLFQECNIQPNGRVEGGSVNPYIIYQSFGLKVFRSGAPL